MRRRVKRPRRLALVHVLSLAVALVVGLFILTKKLDGASLDAFAAPPPAHAPKSAPLADAGAAHEHSDDAAVASSRGAEPGSKEKKDGGDRDVLGESTEPDPIDLAVAPNGGVPTHPGAIRFKSPFAKPTGRGPVDVKVAMLLNSIDGYDVKSGTFTADFFISFTSDKPMPPLSLQFPNGKVENKETIADKPTFKLVRLSGAFKSPADLRKYPFDSQELKIVVEDDIRGIDQLRFVVDKERTQLARGFRAVGWQVSFVEAKTVAQSYPDRFENDDLFYSRYTFNLGLDRFATSAAFTVYVPAFVIVIISILGMWVPPEEMEVRSNSGAPMLAGAVLFHFALMQELPATSYLTRADKIMMGVYISLMLGMLSTWWMFIVDEQNLHKVFRIARIVVPIASAATMIAVCLL